MVFFLIIKIKQINKHVFPEKSIEVKKKVMIKEVRD